MQARANRGILYVDEVNLLDDGLVDVVLDSSASGINTVEREGISIAHPAKFIMIGSGNPAVCGAARHVNRHMPCLGVVTDTHECDTPALTFTLFSLLEKRVHVKCVIVWACIRGLGVQGTYQRFDIRQSSACPCRCRCRCRRSQEGELRPQLLDRFGMSVQVCYLPTPPHTTTYLLRVFALLYPLISLVSLPPILPCPLLPAKSLCKNHVPKPCVQTLCRSVR